MAESNQEKAKEYFQLFAKQLNDRIDYDNPVGKLLKQATEKTKQPVENLVGGAIIIIVPLIMYFFGVTIIWFVFRTFGWLGKEDR